VIKEAVNAWQIFNLFIPLKPFEKVGEVFTKEDNQERGQQ
jgi:hypothetical protein